ASLEGIFKTGFMDEAEIAPELVGYVAIAKGFKIINGDENGNFLPKKALTRAEAAIIIYNYLR
ncbi:MAG: S-layer homology domain-containing protein, partial [Clostridiaceae bacterium]|nr:S-layer homology domain-containing protein [Clostridiaceae bacterium]